MPQFAHIPLIHGADGTKLSKRHGAVDLNQWRLDGYLPVAMRNYLLRLGWSHGDAEIISDVQAAEWFSLEAVGRSPSRLDAKKGKLNSVNGHYMQGLSAASLFALLADHADYPLEPAIVARLETLYCRKKDQDYSPLIGLKQRSKTLVELAEQARVYFCRSRGLTDKAQTLVAAYPSLGLEPGRLLSRRSWTTDPRQQRRWNLSSRSPSWGSAMRRCSVSPCPARPSPRRWMIWSSSWGGRKIRHRLDLWTAGTV